MPAKKAAAKKKKKKKEEPEGPTVDQISRYAKFDEYEKRLMDLHKSIDWVTVRATALVLLSLVTSL